MPRLARVPESLRQLPFRGSEAVRTGLLTWRQLTSGCWHRVLHDVYVHAAVAVTHELRCRAAALAMPHGAAISGASAAFLHGADVLLRDESVEVTVPPRTWMSSKHGLAVHHGQLSAIDLTRRAGIPVTTPVRTAFDLARWREPEDEAVVAVDAVLTKCDLTVEQVRAYAAAHPPPRLIGKLARVLDLAVPGAESPMETRLRLILVKAGLEIPALQHKVYDLAGLFIARLDLAYTAPRLGIEFDGGRHFDAEQVKKDLIRQNGLRAAGWSLLRFTNDDVTRHRSRLVAQVRAAVRS